MFAVLSYELYDEKLPLWESLRTAPKVCTVINPGLSGATEFPNYGFLTACMVWATELVVVILRLIETRIRLSGMRHSVKLLSGIVHFMVHSLLFGVLKTLLACYMMQSAIEPVSCNIG